MSRAESGAGSAVAGVGEPAPEPGVDAMDVHPPEAAVERAVSIALAEDLEPLGDLSGSLVPPDAVARLAVVARQPGVLAGERCARATLARVAPGAETTWLRPDGAALAAGEELALVAGPLRQLLAAERTLLNFLGHLSGVATLTRRYVEAVTAVAPRCRVLDTRKTLPGLRALEKAAVRAGGGHNHRGSLSDAVLLKDNHLGELSIADAVAAARRRWPGRAVEVECDRVDQVEEAVRAGATIIMLDNMDPDAAARCVELVRRHDPSGGVLVEASGGLTVERAAALAAAGVDLVSVGALTHSAPSLDIGLDWRGGGAGRAGDVSED